MLNGDINGHGIADDNMELGYFLDKQNIVCAMMPPAFTDEEIDSIDIECLYDKSRYNSLKQCLNKKTVELLLESDAEYLIIDLYDFHNDIAIYNNTAFSTCAHEFLNTNLYKRISDNVKWSNFMFHPTWTWYPYIDLFFEKIMQKYDSNHIILNRVNCNKYYLGKDGRVKPISENFRRGWHAKYEYNENIRRIEDYIIQKCNPYVIDISKYYLVDENKWDDLNGTHYENGFYSQTFDIIKEIINNKPDKRVYDMPKFMSELDDMKVDCELDIEEGIRSFLMLLEEEDLRWMSILAKLYVVAPEDERVRAYMQVMMEEMGEM